MVAVSSGAALAQQFEKVEEHPEHPDGAHLMVPVLRQIARRWAGLAAAVVRLAHAEPGEQPEASGARGLGGTAARRRRETDAARREQELTPDAAAGRRCGELSENIGCGNTMST